jgi:hypothetical protein
MTRLVPGLIAAGIVALLIGCASNEADLKVHTEYSRDTDFTQLKTFRVRQEFDEDRDRQRSPRLEREVRQAIEDELVNRGYEPLEDTEPDFFVTYELLLIGRKATNAIPTTSASQVEAVPAVARGYWKQGVLTIQVVEPGTNKVLWKATDGGLTPDHVEGPKEIRTAVWRMLVEFPPL